MMRLVMHPDMVYRYPIWMVGLVLIGAAIAGAVGIELLARRLIPLPLRQKHNDVAAAMLSIIGVTYAVLLAFVAMLAWEGFNHAKAASYQEAGAIRGLADAAAGLPEPMGAALRARALGYARAVAIVEWPAQAAGRFVDLGSGILDRVNGMGAALPEGTGRARVLSALDQLWRAREERLLAAQSAIPGIVWMVLVLGGALTIGFGSFLGAPSLAMQLAMSSTLAASGALVLLLVLALSNPFRGDFRVSTAPYIMVMHAIGAAKTPGE